MRFWCVTVAGAIVASVLGATLRITIPAPWGGVVNTAVMVAAGAWAGYRLGRWWNQR